MRDNSSVYTIHRTIMQSELGDFFTHYHVEGVDACDVEDCIQQIEKDAKKRGMKITDIMLNTMR